METKIATRAIDKLKERLNADSVQQQFRNALGANTGTFVASVIDLFNSDAKLQQCDSNALIMESLRAATMHLPLNKALGFSYIVPFEKSYKDAEGKWAKKMEPVFVLGYKGLIQLALRTGKYRTINADAVYEGELRSVNRLTGEIDFQGERKSDKVIGYFAYIELTNGFSKTLYVTVHQMAEHAKRFSKGLKADVSVQSLEELAQIQPEGKTQIGWMGNFSAMAIKTVLRMLLAKYGYLSVEMEEAISSDMRSESYDNEDKYEEVKTVDMGDADVIAAEGQKAIDFEPGY